MASMIKSDFPNEKQYRTLFESLLLTIVKLVEAYPKLLLKGTSWSRRDTLTPSFILLNLPYQLPFIHLLKGVHYSLSLGDLIHAVITVIA